MIDVNDERGWVHIVRIKQGNDWPAAFVIDGREYVDSEAVRAAVEHAYDEFERRRIPAEVESRPVSPTEPPRKLPSWEQYRQQLSDANHSEL